MQMPIISYAINDDDVVQCSIIKTRVLPYYYILIILFALKKKSRSQKDLSVLKQKYRSQNDLRKFF